MRTIYIRVLSLLLTVVAINSGQVFAQELTITGKVIDSKDKSAVIGASVTEQDKDGRTVRGVSTNIEGNFAIKVTNAKNTLSVTFLGYKTFKTPINGRNSINVSLVPTSNELTEVVIVSKKTVDNGTGLNIAEKNITGATATISAKDLEELSAQSIDQALQGRLPGVDIGTSSGDPGAGMAIRIRGTSTINGSADPLVVLDGMPYEVQIPSDFNFGTADEQGYAQLLNIAPTDIKDITVLKDASATAVWGARASNGVLVINTKRGTIGKPQINYTFKGVINQQPKSIPMLSGDQYSMLIPEEYNNLAKGPLDIIRFQEFSYDPQNPYYYYNYSNNVDWVKEVTRIGYQTENNLSMQGGGEKARYYASVGYNASTGTTVGTDLSRLTTKVNLDYIVSSKIKFLSDFSYTRVDNTLNYGNPRAVAFTKMPNMSVYEYDEFGKLSPNYFSPASTIQGQYPGSYNPVAMAELAYNVSKGERIIPHFKLQYSILPNSLLTSTYDIQFDINNTKLTSFLPQLATGRPTTETTVNRAFDADFDGFSVFHKLNFVVTPKLGDNHTFTSLLSFQANDASGKSHSATTSNTATEQFQDPSNPSRTQNSELGLYAGYSQHRDLGLVSTSTYTFLDKYVLSAGARLDGNSRFGQNHRFGLFPQVSGRWRVSQESFMKKLTFLDDLSVRVGYGQSGGTPNAEYVFYNTFNPLSYNYAGLSGVVPGNIGLDNLKWQTKIDKNLGFNVVTKKGRYKVDIDLYNSRIKEMIFNGLQIPGYTGYTSITTNVGVMTNRGFEVNINTVPYKTKKWTINFDLNFAQNLNTIDNVSEYFPKTDGRRINQNGIYRTILQLGNPFGSFYGFRYKGVYSTDADAIAKDAQGNGIKDPNGKDVYMRFGYPAIDYVFKGGDAMYEDINHDGNINEDDIVYLGNGNPKMTGGFGMTVNYKGIWRLVPYFSYRLGYDLINETLMQTTKMSDYDNQSTVTLRRWRNPGDQTDVPRALFRDGYNWLGSDRYVSDASFLRLSSLTLRYNAPKTLSTKLHAKNASAYVVAENLITWTNYKGVDPDVSTRGLNSPFSYVRDQGRTPRSKNFVLGITFGF